MALRHIEIQNVRNIEQAILDFDPGLNLIIGPNASGKTSLLEAISLLAQGRSFRTARIDRLVQHGQKQMLIVGHIQQAHKRITIGLAREARKTRVKVDGQNLTRTTEMIDLLPIHVMTPESHELLDQGPKMRRQYLDWGVFHVKHAYLDVWQRYHRILRQRNRCLRRQTSKSEVQAWDKQLSQEAEQMHAYRQAYLVSLGADLRRLGHQLLDCEPEFAYQPGWKEAEGPYSAQLQMNFDKDQERGFSQLGPHRADLQMKIDGKPVQNVFSRGQQKLLVCVMTLAQIGQQRDPGLVLVDDLPSELDPDRRSRLMHALKETRAQVFVSATELGLISTTDWPSSKLFHVKHGQFQEVV